MANQPQGQVYLFRHDGSRPFAGKPRPHAAARLLGIDDANVYALVSTGKGCRPELCPYNISTPDSSDLPVWLRGKNFESAWQVPKAYPHYPKHTQILAKGNQASFRNHTAFSPYIPHNVPLCNINGRDFVGAMPPAFYADALSGELPIRSTVPKFRRKTCIGIPNPFDLDGPLLQYLPARVAIYGPLYVASVLANPEGAALVAEIRAKLAAGENVLLSETDGPVPEMPGVETHDATGITYLRCTPENLTRIVTTHAAHPAGHCFFLAAELLGVRFPLPPLPPPDLRTFGEVLAAAKAIPRPGAKRQRVEGA